MNFIKAMQTPDTYRGRLRIQITSEITSHPIENASIQISYTGVPDSTLEELTTDSSGQTETVELPSPPLEYSLNPSIEEQPYSEYTLHITAPGFEPVTIAGTEILADVTALQNVRMRPSLPEENPDIFVIPAHTLQDFETM